MFSNPNFSNTLNNSFIGLLSSVMNLIFSVWPLIVIAPIQRRKHILYNMTVAWGAMFAAWLLSLLGSTHTAFLIPEPLNTILFFVTGVALIGWQISAKNRQRSDVQLKSSQVTKTDDLLQLSPTEFENMVVEYYRALGYKAKRTGMTGDHGIDVIAQAPDGENWAVQCKRWRGSVGEPIVRDFYGVMQHEKADKGAVITTGKFTSQAKEWAAGKPIILLDGDKFLAELRRTRQTVNEQPSANKYTLDKSVESLSPPRCPKCGASMVLRIAKKGENAGGRFWGCSTYPQCRGILQYQG